MKFRRILIAFLIAVLATLAVNTFFKKQYPADISQDLFDQCFFSRPKADSNNREQEVKFCKKAVSEFQNSVPYDAYEDFYQNLYENYKRAFSHKYRNEDLFTSISPSDKSIFNVMDTTIYKDASAEQGFMESSRVYFDPARFEEHFNKDQTYRTIDRNIAINICMVFIYGQNYKTFPAQEDQFKLCENRFNFLQNTLSFKEFLNSKFDYSGQNKENLYYNTLYGIPTKED